VNDHLVDVCQLLAERTAQSERASQAAVDAKNEVEVLRRQNTARLKELNKELAAAKVSIKSPAKLAAAKVSIKSLAEGSS
jgi:hypothetical protein